VVRHHVLQRMLRKMNTAHPERGATAIIVAISLLLLFGIAAFAVDLGGVFNEDRQDQTAADVAALAAAIEYTGTGTSAVIRQTVFDFVEANVDTTYTAAEWQSLWETCTDPSRPAGFNAITAPAGWSVATIDCISGSTDELRVKVPDQLVGMTFGQVVGVNTIAARAIAHAAVQFRQGGSVRPFGILNGVSAGSTCLTTAPGGLAAPPCDGPASGNFGTLNSQTWAELLDISLLDCGLPGNNELGQNIAVGIDHLIGLAPTFAGSGGSYGAFPASSTRLDDCDGSSGQALPTDNTPELGPVDTMRADTGFNLFAATKAGLLSGTAADFPNASVAPTPLLRQVSGSGVFSTRTIRERISSTPYNYTVDNTPLWMHLLDPASIPGAVSVVCDKAVIQVAVDPSAAMHICLSTYEALGVTGPLFASSLDDNPRFGWVPQFHFTTWGSGTHWQPILTYRMVYIDTIWFNCNGKFDPAKNDEPCTGAKGLVFQPYMQTADPESTLQVGNGASMKELRIDQISAFLFPNAAVPTDVAENFPGNVRGPFEVVLTR